MNFCEPSARTGRVLIPKAHAQELKTPDDIQVEQRVRVVDATVVTRPPRLLPAIKAANHHLRRMDQVVIQMVNLTRSKSPGPMHFFQLASETSLAGRGHSACKEAILEMAGQKRPVLQVLDRLSLGVQNGLYVLDDFFAMRKKKSQQLDVCLKRRQLTQISLQAKYDAPDVTPFVGLSFNPSSLYRG